MQIKKSFFIALTLIFLSFENINSMLSLKTKSSKLKDSIKSGDVQKFEKIMNSGLSSNYKFYQLGSSDVPLIIYIVTHGNYEILKSLVKRPEKSNYSMEALKITYANSREDLTKLILKNIQCKFYDWQAEELTKPFLANDNLKIFKIFIERNFIDINQEFAGYFDTGDRNLYERFNLLTYAISYKAIKIVKYLLTKNNICINTYNLHRAKIKTFNNIVTACVSGNDDIIKQVLNHPQADFREAILWISSNDEFYGIIPDDVYLALKNKSNIQNRNSMDLIALKEKNLPGLFDPNVNDDNGNNILHLALKHKNYVLYSNVLKAKRKLLNKFNLNSQTPQDLLVSEFINVIKKKNSKSLKKLITQVGFSNIKDSNGDTLLHHAIKSCYLKNIKILLYFILLYEPQLLFVKNNQGDTPIHLAVQVYDSEKGYFALSFLVKSAYKN